MGYLFKKASRENVWLLIGLAGASGSGKTYTAMRLASGISGGKPFAVIDTESRRALHYAEQFVFDHCELNPPFRPENYIAALEAAKGKYNVVVIDSMSHEHAGEGGLLDWHEELLNQYVNRARHGNKDRSEWQIREANTMRAWIEPKMAHKKFVQYLLRSEFHIILCFRAEEKLDIVKDDHGKTQIVPKKSSTGLNGWIPICEKNMPYELTCSFLMTPDMPGFPKPIKLQEQHKKFFPLDKPISEDSGRLLAGWAAGNKTPVSDGSSQKDLFPADWGMIRERGDEKSGLVSWRDLKIEQLEELKNNGKHREYAIFELKYRIFKFGEVLSWNENFMHLIGGDINNIPEEELGNVANSAYKFWKNSNVKKT